MRRTRVAISALDDAAFSALDVRRLQCVAMSALASPISALDEPSVH